MKFKCKSTGNVFEFTQEHDIKTMKEHPEYEVVQEEIEEPKPVKPARKPSKQDQTEE